MIEVFMTFYWGKQDTPGIYHWGPDISLISSPRDRTPHTFSQVLKTKSCPLDSSISL